MPITNDGLAERIEQFSNTRLLAHDFDSTVALTGELSPGGIDVEGAYEIAVELTFGSDALATYRNGNRLNNRAPVEVIKQLAPDAGEAEHTELVGRLVGAKLDVLMSEIGTTFPDGNVWPRPSKGFLELLNLIETSREEGRAEVDRLIISSGHDVFIDKTFAAWGITDPGILLTVETAARLAETHPADQLVKPSGLLMDIARSMWREEYGLNDFRNPSTFERGRILYAGDDPSKDGELARNGGVDFVLVDQERSVECWAEVATKLCLGHLAIGIEVTNA